MLFLVTLFLVSLLISMAAIWLYRSVSDWQISEKNVVGRRNKTMGKKLKTQLGFISPPSASRKKAQIGRCRNPKGGTKAPWGW
jgi:hypothetical protein